MRIARELAGSLAAAPAAVLLYGELGAGKTAFVRGLVEGAGGCPDDVSSPTFVLMQEYPGRRVVQHVDLYRLGADEAADVAPLVEEMLAGDAIVAIEWADRLPGPPEPAVRVRIVDRGGDDRDVAVEVEEPLGAGASRREHPAGGGSATSPSKSSRR